MGGQACDSLAARTQPAEGLPSDRQLRPAVESDAAGGIQQAARSVDRWRLFLGEVGGFSGDPGLLRPKLTAEDFKLAFELAPEPETNQQDPPPHLIRSLSSTWPNRFTGNAWTGGVRRSSARPDLRWCTWLASVHDPIASRGFQTPSPWRSRPAGAGHVEAARGKGGHGLAGSSRAWAPGGAWPVGGAHGYDGRGLRPGSEPGLAGYQHQSARSRDAPVGR